MLLDAVLVLVEADDLAMDVHFVNQLRRLPYGWRLWLWLKTHEY